MQLFHARHDLKQAERSQETKDGEAQVKQEEYIRGYDDNTIEGVDEIGQEVESVRK